MRQGVSFSNSLERLRLKIAGLANSSSGILRNPPEPSGALHCSSSAWECFHCEYFIMGCLARFAVEALPAASAKAFSKRRCALWNLTTRLFPCLFEGHVIESVLVVNVSSNSASEALPEPYRRRSSTTLAQFRARCMSSAGFLRLCLQNVFFDVGFLWNASSD